MNKKALINGFVCFVLGVGVGLAAHKVRRSFRPPHPMEGEKFIEHFSDKLDLSEEQTQQVRPIFQEARERMQALRSDVGPRFRQIREDTKEKLRPILNPEQQEKLEQMHARIKERHQKMRERFGGPPFMRGGEHRGEPQKRGSR